MPNRTEYPCDEALNDLQDFLDFHIKNKNELKKFTELLEDCRKANRIGFRHIHEEIMNYRKRTEDYFPFSDKERQMINDLLYFWA